MVALAATGLAAASGDGFEPSSLLHADRLVGLSEVEDEHGWLTRVPARVVGSAAG